MEIQASHSGPLIPPSKVATGAKVAVSLIVTVSMAALAKMVGLHARGAIGMGLLSGVAVYTFSSLDYRLPWGMIKDRLFTKKLDAKELMALEDAKFFGREADIVKPIGIGDLSGRREAALQELAKLVRSSSNWESPEVQQAYSKYLNLTLEQANSVIVEIRNKYPDDVKAQARAFAEGEDNCFEIFAAVRDAYEFALEGRYCTDPTNSNSKEVWQQGGRAPSEQLSEWRSQYNQFCDTIQPIMNVYPESRVPTHMVKNLENGEWDKPPTRHS